MESRDREGSRFGLGHLVAVVVALGAAALSLVSYRTAVRASEPSASQPEASSPGNARRAIVRDRVVVRDPSPPAKEEAAEEETLEPAEPHEDAVADPGDVKTDLMERGFRLDQRFEASPVGGGFAGVKEQPIRAALTQSFSEGGKLQDVECRATECRAIAVFDDRAMARAGIQKMAYAPEVGEFAFSVSPSDGDDWTRVTVYFHAPTDDTVEL